MNFLKLLFIYFFLLLLAANCSTNNSCGQDANIVYNLGFSGCDYLIDLDGQLYEPSNLNEWQDFMFYTDTQSVVIDFQFTNEFSTCSGLEKIDIFCLTNI